MSGISKGDLSPPPHSHYKLNSDTASTQRDFQISTHVSSYLAHLMHAWNWFTGARSGTHISISSSTELKFYHLFDFKAKNTQLTLLHRGRNLSKASFFPSRVGLQLPHSHPRSWTQCLVSLRAVRKSNAHVSIPLSCSSHEPSQKQKACQGMAYWLSFLSRAVEQSRVRSAWLNFWKGNTLKVPSKEFSPQNSELWDTQPFVKCKKVNINAH